MEQETKSNNEKNIEKSLLKIGSSLAKAGMFSTTSETNKAKNEIKKEIANISKNLDKLAKDSVLVSKLSKDDMLFPNIKTTMQKIQKVFAAHKKSETNNKAEKLDNKINRIISGKDGIVEKQKIIISDKKPEISAPTGFRHIATEGNNLDKPINNLSPFGNNVMPEKSPNKPVYVTEKKAPPPIPPRNKQTTDGSERKAPPPIPPRNKQTTDGSERKAPPPIPPRNKQTTDSLGKDTPPPIPLRKPIIRG